MPILAKDFQGMGNAVVNKIELSAFIELICKQGRQTTKDKEIKCIVYYMVMNYFGGSLLCSWDC
jgi:hypothetical protein